MLPHFCKLVTLCLEIGVRDSKDSEIKDYLEIVLNQGVAGAGKAKLAPTRRNPETLTQRDTRNPGFSMVARMAPDTLEKVLDTLTRWVNLAKQ